MLGLDIARYFSVLVELLGNDLPRTSTSTIQLSAGCQDLAQLTCLQSASMSEPLPAAPLVLTSK